MTRLSVLVVVRWTLGIAIGVAIVGLPVLYYRMTYEHSRRLRVVAEGKLYRSGLMTARGLDEAIETYKIRTVICLMEESPDPKLREAYFDRRQVRESEVCERHRVRLLHFPLDLISRNAGPAQRPEAIDRFLQIMDDPTNHPVLIHCKAGLHRTGILAAVYRMEYDGWSPPQAWYELRDNGFGETNCYGANDYVVQYIVKYRPGLRKDRATGRIVPVASPAHAAACPREGILEQ